MMPRQLISIAIFMCLPFALAMPLQARQAIYTSQSRSVSAGGGSPGVSNSDAAPDFGPFNGNITVNGPNPDAQPDSVGFATQNSSLMPGGITITGTVGGADNYPFGGVGFGGGTSTLDVEFDLADPTAFAFSASGEYNAAPFGSFDYSSAFLAHGGSDIFNWSPSVFGVATFSAVGMLNAGHYRLRAEFSSGYGGQGSGGGSMDYSAFFSVPEPGTALAIASMIVLVAARRGIRSRIG